MRVLRVRYQDKFFYAALLQQESPEGEGPILEVQCLNKEMGFAEPIPLQQVQVVPPVVPTKIVCLAVNYRTHANEVGRAIPDEPVLFLKPPSAVIGSGQPIIMPPQSKRVDYEGELALIIGKHCRNVAPEDAAGCLFGYACANDVTARDLQKKDGLFARAKGFDTFAPIGPWIETQVDDPGNLRLRTFVNDTLRQEGSTSDMIFTPFEALSFVSSVMTLQPGDVILTGTPAGIGSLNPGDEVRVEIEGVGALINPVISAVLDEPSNAPLQ